MFSQWNDRKRARDEDGDDDYEYSVASGFSEHRTKRHIASLPHRQSPKLNRYATPSMFTLDPNYTTKPAPPTITPADSESEATPRTAEPKSFFSPYSSSPGETVVPSDPSSPQFDSLESSQSAQVSAISFTPIDYDMMDISHISSHQPQYSSSISGRIPTPIHSSFAPSIRAEKAALHHFVDDTDDEALISRFKRGRRLPSPISEGETSPSIIADGLEEMQMDVDNSRITPQPELQDPATTLTPTKKGHQRSKHSVRQWSGFGGDMSSAGAGMKRSFSMGYRSDCEKCRQRVPGHFSHIVTY